MSKRLSFWADDEIIAEMTQRGPLSSSARQALERYYWILKTERRLIRHNFTDAELNFMLEACQTATWAASNILGGVAELCLQSPQPLYNDRNVDRNVLWLKLKRLTPAQQAALVDAIERWCQSAMKGDQLRVAELLA